MRLLLILVFNFQLLHAQQETVQNQITNSESRPEIKPENSATEAQNQTDKTVKSSLNKSLAEMEEYSTEILSKLGSLVGDKASIADVLKNFKSMADKEGFQGIQDTLFAGEKSNLRGEPAEKKNGVEELISVSLAPLRVMNPRRLEQVLLDKFAGGPLYDLFAQDYKALSFLVKVIQDPYALPMLGRMVDQRTKFYIFLGLVITSIIFLYFYKRKKFKDLGFMATLVPRFFLFIGAMIFRFTVLGLLFYKEVSPMIMLTYDHWFKG